MPADRTRSQRNCTEDPQSVWSMCSESAKNGIAFAPNVTPVTFNDPPPPMVDALLCESLLFPSAESCPAPRKPAHSKKKPENHIPRPPNAFILFRSSFIKSQHVSTEVETNHSTLSKIIGLTWQNLPNEERQIWHAKAKAALDEHKRKYPQYAFKPLHGKAKGAGAEKRKVREVGPKDIKRCEKIAQLLVQGKKGLDLDAAIQEFDKHHVPEIITRFEAPLTANMYRRSISGRGDGTDNLSVSTSSRGSKSTSSKPPRKSSSTNDLITSHSPISVPTPYSLEQTQAIAPENYYTLSSFDQYSFPPKQEPSFDFNTFSFDNVAPSMPLYPCQTATTSMNGMFSQSSDLRPPQLSIDTSFMDSDNWTRSSSPMSTSTSSMPATPCYIDSPSPNAYEPYAYEPFHPTMQNAYEDLSQYPVYTNDCSVVYNGSDMYPSASVHISPFERQSKSELAHAMDHNYPSFVGSQSQC